LIEGEKTFYFLEPTNDRLFDVVLAECCEPRGAYPLKTNTDDLVKVRLIEGEGIFIPGGYIHCVHTVLPSRMTMSNFLHDYGIERQILIWRMERDFRGRGEANHFLWLNWLAASDLLRRVTHEIAQGAKTQGHSRHEDLVSPTYPVLPTLDSILSLADFLVVEADDVVEDVARMRPPDIPVSAAKILMLCEELKAAVGRLRVLRALLNPEEGKTAEVPIDT